MDAVQAGILSLLIALSGALRDGLQAFKDGKNDEAIAALTKVVDEKSPDAASFKSVALYYRAQAYAAKKDKERAVADLTAFLKMDSLPPELAKSGKELFIKLGGDLKKLLPAVSPKQVFRKFLDALAKEDAETAKSLCAKDGTMLMMLPMGARQEFDGCVLGEEKIGEGDSAGTATLRVTMPNTPPEFFLVFRFVLDRKKDAWLIVGLDQEAMARNARRMAGGGRKVVVRGGGGGNGGGNATRIANENKLKQIGLACRMYSNVYDENFPDSLDALREDFLENDDVYVWVNPAKPKQCGKFVYCPGLTESDDVDSMVAAAPAPYKGTRAVLFLDGHVKAIPENEFLANAKKQNWRVPGLVKKKDIPEKKRKEIRALVEQLGAADFETRKNAKEKLKAMGIDAYPILEEYKNSKDPEVKMSVKELLSGK